MTYLYFLASVVWVAATAPAHASQRCTRPEAWANRVVEFKSISSSEVASTRAVLKYDSKRSRYEVAAVDGPDLIVGQCFSPEGNGCALKGEMSDLMGRAIALKVGYKSMSSIPFRVEIPQGQFDVHGTFSCTNEHLKLGSTGTITIEGKSEVVNQRWQTTSPLNVFSPTIHFAEPGEIIQRITLNQETAQIRNLGESIFAVSRPEDAGSSFLVNTLLQLATAFVVDGRGFLITNLHVTEELHCKVGQPCQVRFSRRRSDNSVVEFIAPAMVVAEDSKFDFALIRILNPPTTLTPLSLSPPTSIGPEIVSVGHPADLCQQLPHKACAPQLIFSHGVLTSIEETGFISSAFSFGGASGGPVLDATTLSVIGFNSKGITEGAAAGPATIVYLENIRSQLMRALEVR